MAKIKKNVEKSDKKLLLLAQDIKFAKSLASNNKRLRDRALKALKKWLQLRLLKMPFTEKDFMLLWKGLFYTMWMSDKLLIQEECAENISSLVHFTNWEDSLLFFKCGLKTLVNQWFGIDQLRLDKFAMFVRRFLRQGLVVLENENWNEKTLERFNEILSETVLCIEKLPPLGLCMHFTEIFLEELAKVSKGKIEPAVTTTLLKPFIKQLALLRDLRQVGHISKFIFRQLMWQSDLGLDYNERYGEWKRLGFPGGTIDVIQKEELSDDEVMSDSENEDDPNKPLDPRAGRVDVELPQIPFDPQKIADSLKEFRFIKGTTTRNRKCINKLINEFEQLSKGEFPLGVKRLPTVEKDKSLTLKKSVNRLVKFEKKILGKNKRKRKLNKENKIEDSSESEHEIQSPPKEKKRKKLQDVSFGDFLGERLEEFIANSEGHLQNDASTVQKKKKTIGKKVKMSDINEMNKVLTKRKKLATNLYKTENIKTGAKKLKKNTININKNKQLKLESSFRRNSGTWYVYEVEPEKVEENVQNNDVSSETKTTPSNEIKSNLTTNEKAQIDESNILLNGDSVTSEIPKNSIKQSLKVRRKSINYSSDTDELSTFQQSKKSSKENPKPLEKLQEKIQEIPNTTSETTEKNSVSPNNTSVIAITSKNISKLEDSLTSSTPLKDRTAIDNSFPQDEWDLPLKEGETEIFVPSKKYQMKMEKIAKKNNQSVPSLLNDSIKKLTEKKKKISMDSNLVRNPFSKVSLTGSVKKVKIALNLNKSQEIHEHLNQIRSSPAIPFDAQRKPSKPLLKKPVIASPINPFYKNKLSL